VVDSSSTMPPDDIGHAPKSEERPEDTSKSHFSVPSPESLPAEKAHGRTTDAAGRTSQVGNSSPTSESGAKSSAGKGVFTAVAVVCLVAAALVVALVLRRRRLRRQGYNDFGSLEMRDYAQWQDNAGV
jgi:hypothetical protein